MRSILLAVFLSTSASLAIAQPAASPPGGTAEPTLRLTVSGSEIALIGEGLGQLPFSRVAPPMAKLQGQLQAQSQAAASTPLPGAAPPASEPPK